MENIEEYISEYFNGVCVVDDWRISLIEDEENQREYFGAYNVVTGKKIYGNSFPIVTDREQAISLKRVFLVCLVGRIKDEN